MILAEKIIRLRKQFSWSQEDLAEKMGVSRQSVSKWESTNSIPDLNKIIALASIFGVTTDFLLKDEMNTIESTEGEIEPGLNKINLDQANRYIEIQQLIASITLKGVILCVCAVTPLFFLLAMSQSPDWDLSSNTAVITGIVLMLVLIALGVGQLIKINQFASEIATVEEESFELEYGVESIFKEKLQQFLPSYHQRLAIGIAMFIGSAIPFLLAIMTSGQSAVLLSMIGLMFFIISLGLYIVVPVSSHHTAINRLLKEGDFMPKKRQNNKRIEALAAFYFPLLVAVYLGWSFWTMNWGFTWIVWPVGVVGFGALVGLMGLLKSKNV